MGRPGLVLLGVAILVLVNLYVFVWSKRSVRSVYRHAKVQSTAGSKGQSAPDAGLTAADRAPAAHSPLDLRLPHDITALALGEEEDEALLEVEAYTVHGVIRRGDNLYAALKRTGVNRLLGDTIVRTLEHLYDFRKARPGQRFSVKLSQDRQRLLAFDFQASPEENFRIGRQGKKLQGSRVHKPAVTRVFEMMAPVRDTLWGAFQSLGEDGRLLASFVAMFSWDLNLYTDIRKGDLIRLVLEKEYQGDEFLRYGRVLAAELLGARKRIQGFWYRAPRGGGGYYDVEGQSLNRVLLRAPLKYGRISSQFDPRRMHPILHRVRPHLGTDYAAPTGTPVWAMADGDVIYIGRNKAAGNMVVLEHEGGVRTVYMHLHAFRPGLKKGDKVRQREVVGTVGATGMATGPHLHFGLKVNGVYVDPEQHERVRRPPVPGHHRADFLQHITPLDGAMRALPTAPQIVKRLAGPTVVAVSERYRSR